MANANLGAARVAKQDEFYTQWADIEREMNAYLEYDPDVFRDKVVLLPCDDPEWSNFAKFFALHFQDFGLKKLISTSYAPESNAGGAFYTPTLFDDPHFDAEKDRVRGKIFVLEREDISGDGRVDIDDLKWDYLKGDGDFRSPEVTALRDKSDVVVTNPPFSLFRGFLAWLVAGGVQFSIIGSNNAITYKDSFALIKKNQMWKGATGNSTDMVFRVPSSVEVKESDRLKAGRLGYLSSEEEKFTRLGNSCWFTNIEHGRRHEPLQLMTLEDNLRFGSKKIRSVGYPVYDNYDAIEVPETLGIPADFDGIMGVPVTFLDRYNPEQFEIVGRGEDIEWARSEDCGFFTPTTPELQNLYRSQDKTWRIQNPYLIDADGHARTVFKRLFIRHLNPAPRKDV